MAETAERTAPGPSRPSDFTRVGQGAASFLISTGVGMASSLLRTILLARALGVGRYGALTLAVSIASIAQAVTGLGLSSGVTRTMAFARAEHDEPRARRLLNASVIGGVLTGLVGTGVVLLLGWIDVITGFGTSTALLILAPLVLASSVRSALYGGLRAYQDIGAIFIMGIVPALIDVVVVAGLVLAGVRGVAWYAAALLCLAYVDLVLVTGFVRRGRGLGSPADTTWVDFKALMRFSLPLVVAQLMFFAIQRSDVVLLGVFHSPAEVGLYAPVMRLSEAAVRMLGAFPLLYMPIATAYVARGQHDRLRDLYADVTKWAYLLGFAVTLALVVSPRQVLPFLFGDPYSEMDTVARVLAAGYWVSLAAGLNAATLGARGDVKQMAGYSTVGVALNLGLAFALIPPFGPAGAAWSNTISYVVVNVMYSVLLFRRARIHPFRRDTVALYAFSLAVVAVAVAVAELPSMGGRVAALGITAAAVAVWLLGGLLGRPFHLEWAEIKRIVGARRKGMRNMDGPGVDPGQAVAPEAEAAPDLGV